MKKFNTSHCFQFTLYYFSSFFFDKSCIVSRHITTFGHKVQHDVNIIHSRKKNCPKGINKINNDEMVAFNIRELKKIST